MKRRASFLAFAVSAILLLVSAADTPQQRYIDRWAATAVREMYRSGVPASITLAQGILESRSGLSALAAEGNNHFGIKCHKDWKGKTMRVDDDRKGECFRVYDTAEESFRDHSDFLRYWDRYKFLFDFDTKDYESWAYGLKKAGYATDPSYPEKLIKIIEENGLSKYDSMTQAQASRASSSPSKATPAPPKTSDKASSKSASKSSEKASAKESKAAAKAAKVSKADEREAARAARKAARRERLAAMEVIPDEIPEAPNALEEAVLVTPAAAEEFHFSLTRPVYTRNGVPFVYSVEGESYSSIASSYNLFPKEILKINDMDAERILLPGTVVYIQQKKNQAEKGLDKYIVEADGENLRDICQRFAVRMSSVCKMNGFSAGHALREGDTIILRKPGK
ncbi:MAG: glucosaminidase domain-containing protein [Bacteroidales bacterium]|nr:glucosaminidase domain-containing protein [Bacteroidales bacterium]